MMFRVLAAIVAPALALEPFVPPIAVQTAMQASLPDVISINYDVPKAGLTSLLSAIKAASDKDAYFRASLYGASASTSFLQRRGKTDVFFEAGSATAMESDYQTILKGVESQIEASFQNIRASVLPSVRGSFLGLSPSGEPNIRIFVDPNMKGKKVDMIRLTADAFAYASKRLAALESEIMG